MSWQPGQSGNPKGRPKKTRALTELLEQAGSKMVLLPEGAFPRNYLVAEAAFELAATGRAVLRSANRTQPDIELTVTSVYEWLDVVKFIYTQVDGPARQEVDLSTPDGTSRISIIEVVKTPDTPVQ